MRGLRRRTRRAAKGPQRFPERQTVGLHQKIYGIATGMTAEAKKPTVFDFHARRFVLVKRTAAP
jgi:hypothetical protein